MLLEAEFRMGVDVLSDGVELGGVAADAIESFGGGFGHQVLCTFQNTNCPGMMPVMSRRQAVR